MNRPALLILSLLCASVPLVVSPAFADDVTRDNVVVLLDASGSMAGPMPGDAQRRSKMDVARAALLAALDRVPAGSADVGLLVFGRRDGWAYELAPPDPAELRRVVEAIRPGGGTPLGEFTKVAADALLAAREKQFGYGTYRLLVVTDGEATDGRLLARHLPDVLSRGLRVDVIGVAMDGDHALAASAHSYRRADDAAGLERSLQEVLGEIGGGVGTAGGDGSADADFALLAPLAPQTAAAMLLAVSSPADAPIGERPAGAGVPSALTPPGASPAPGVRDAFATPADPARDGGRSFGGTVLRLLFFLFVAFIITRVLRSLFRGFSGAAGSRSDRVVGRGANRRRR